MKGIVLAGGFGTHLYPMTFSGSKHLLPIYDKPLVYYSLATLMKADIRDVLFIVNPQDMGAYEAHFGDGYQLGMNIQYKAQESRDGIAQAFLIGEDSTAPALTRTSPRPSRARRAPRCLAIR